MVQMGWDEAAHLDAKAKKELLDSTPEWLRDARSKGEPTMGSGNIYPIPIADIEVEPFMIPSNWRRGYGLDVGWNRTAAVFAAQDPSEGTMYLYAEHYLGREKPIVHAASIKERGSWMRGAADPASRASNQHDGQKLMEMYAAEGLLLVPANNEVNAGLEALWQLFSMGRLKVFSTLQHWKQEYRVYRRDEHGKIVKVNDHLMDATRYVVRTWEKIAGLPPAPSSMGAWNSVGHLDSVAGI